MKANELMLGDWVYGLYPDGSRYKPPFRISAVDTYPSNKSPRIVTGGGYGFQEEHLAPIPLTPEILEKNGLKPDAAEDAYAYRYQIDGVSLVECYANTEGRYRGIFAFGDTRLRISLRFVHELQHALRLCGIDKEIIL